MNSLEKKQVYTSILSDALQGYKHRIVACFAWETSDQVFSFSFSQDDTITIRINLNAGKNLFDLNGNSSTAFFLSYRAHLITTYLRSIEMAYNKLPETYSDGLLLLCATNDINEARNGHKVCIRSVIGMKRIKWLTPLEVACAKQSLLQTIVEFHEMLLPDAFEKCQTMLDELVTFLQYPEIVYSGSRYPTFSILREMQRMLSKSGEDNLLKPFRFMSQFSLNEIGSLPLDAFFQKCEASGNQFWLGAALRIIALLSRNGIRCNATTLNHIEELADSYHTGVIDIFRKCADTNQLLLKENLAAIKIISTGINCAIHRLEPKSGVVHNYI